MHCFKRDIWKAGIAIAGVLLLLVFMIWISAPAAGAQGGASESATPETVTVQTTPTVDATVTALNKEQLTLQVKQLQNQLQNQNNWFFINSNALIAALSAIIIALFGIYQWAGNRKDARQKEIAAQDKELEDRQAERVRRDEEQERWLKDQEAEREKRAEERFQSAVAGLGDDKDGAKIGAAILLRTFLRQGYEEFYTQTFDLAVANLRLRNVDPNTPEPPDTLSQALITAFKESFPLARKRMKKEDPHFNPQSLDASYTQLDKANLNFADLERAWMPGASLREANLFKANLIGANLAGANLSRANLIEAKLNSNGTSLNGANLSGAHLNKADLSQADLSESHLNVTDLSNADLSYANLGKVFLADAHLSGADLSSAHLFDTATSLERADLHGVKGLTKEQLKVYKAKGAIIDEDSTAIPSQSTVTPPQPGPGTNAQAPSASPTQGSVPTPDANESGAPSSKPNPEP